MIHRAPIANRAVAVPRAEGCFFRSGARARFGWLHRPAAGAETGVGLVIVPPFGYEAICAHRGLRHLAEVAAHAGVVSVRVDVDGTGDSEGDDLEHGRLDAWLASIGDACDLARTAGADRIVIAGVRLGAALAMLAAGKRTDIAGVIAIAGVSTGKAWLREGRALQMQLGLAPPPALPAEVRDDIHELVGFALTSETRTTVSQLDLAKLAHAPRSVLLIDRDDLPPNDKWATALRALGAEVEQVRLPGYVEMVLDPHLAAVPSAIIEAAVAYTATRPRIPETPPRGELSVSPQIELASGVTEEVVALDDCMVGIATRAPRPKPTTGLAVILINAGAVHRVGPNRLHVALARALAARGDLALRVDLSGLGDSRARADCDENVVYGDRAVDDVGVAVAWARGQGARQVAVVGLCSGAYHALKAAVDGQLIDTIVPINPLTFFWKPGMPLDFAAFRVTSETARYQQSLKSVESWRKLLRGKVDLARVARIFVERARSVAAHRAREVGRRLRLPLRDDLGSELLELGRRDVRMRFIFASADPGQAMLLEQGGSAVARLARNGQLGIRAIAGPDHTFTPRWSHPVLLEAILRAVS